MKFEVDSLACCTTLTERDEWVVGRIEKGGLKGFRPPIRVRGKIRALET